jgi:hypothetical protein
MDKNGVNPTAQLLIGVARVSIKNEGTREINYGKCITASRPDRITAGTHCIGGSNDKIGVYPSTQLLNGVAFVSIKYEGTLDINYGNCIAASRPDRITSGTHWILGSNDKNGVYPSKQLIKGVALVSIKNEGTRKINYGICTSGSGPDRITHVSH